MAWQLVPSSEGLPVLEEVCRELPMLSIPLLPSPLFPLGETLKHPFVPTKLILAFLFCFVFCPGGFKPDSCLLPW